ncbi:MAG: metal ABC transporter permease [Rhodothermales bacterium]|nr:metal ABC transporter permease [Rhodothermales bacterium]
MSEMLSLPFMQRALIAGVLVAALSSYLGVFVVQRRLSFLGSGLAHAAFGGVALGLLLQTDPLWVAIPFTIAVAIAINWVRDRTILSGDTAVGIFFAVAMALGIIFITLRDDYTVDAFSYLFGSILMVSRTDLWLSGGLVVTCVISYPLWARWAYATFDSELATSDRLNVARDDYVLSVLLAVTVVVTVKVVGVLLVAAFLVLPAASARLLTRRFVNTTLVAVAIGILTAVAGLVTSFYADVPSGATIILTQAAVFVVGMGVARGVAGKA